MLGQGRGSRRGPWEQDLEMTDQRCVRRKTDDQALDVGCRSWGGGEGLCPQVQGAQEGERLQEVWGARCGTCGCPRGIWGQLCRMQLMSGSKVLDNSLYWAGNLGAVWE